MVIKHFIKKNKQFKLNVTSKIICLLITVSVLPAIILGIFQYNNVKVFLEESFKNSATEKIKLANITINEFFEDVSSKIDDIANGTVRLNNVEEQKKHLDLAVSSNKYVHKICLAYLNGSALLSKNYVLNEKTRLQNEKWYLEVIGKKNKLYISDVHKDSDGDKVISVSKSVYDENNKLFGVMCVYIKISKFQELMKDINDDQNQHVYLVDNNRIRLTHVKTNLIGQPLKSLKNDWPIIVEKKSGEINYSGRGVQKDCLYSTNKLTGWKIINSINISYINSKSKFLIKTYSIFILFMIIISTLIGCFFNKYFGGIVKKINLSLENMAKGNFTNKLNINTKDEMQDIAENINKTNDSIKVLIGESSKASSDVVDVSQTMADMIKDFSSSLNQVSDAVENIAVESTSQVKNSENITEEIDNLNNIIIDVSSSNDKMNILSNDSNKLSTNGIKIMEHLENVSENTKEVTASVNGMFKELTMSIKKIVTMADTIAEIADQTNLLSLNASIEAARAGDAGKGFSIVAEEVRNLSEESREYSSNINKIILEVQSKFLVVNDALENSEVQYNDIYKAVQDTKLIFNDIYISLNKLTNEVSITGDKFKNVKDSNNIILNKVHNNLSLAEGIAATTEEVSATTTELNENVFNIKKYSNNLEDICDKLETQVNKFKF